MDTEFPSRRKIMEISGGEGSTERPPWNGKSWGWGSNWKKTSQEGMDIFWNHTLAYKECVNHAKYCTLIFHCSCFNPLTVLEITVNQEISSKFLFFKTDSVQCMHFF